MNSITVVIPTYNESDNITNLMSQIFSIKLPISVLVVDDSSPDGTGAVAEKLVNKYTGKLFVLHRHQKSGLGAAYISGFKWVLKHLNPDLIMTMDADFSHNPQKIPDLVQRISEGYDVVVGSRYVPGGGVNWKLHRRLKSRAANWLANIVLNLGVNDTTGAFRCYKRQVIQTLVQSEIKSQGYSFFQETLFYCKKNKFKMAEVPIFFADRKKGKSKLANSETLKFFLTLLKLKFKK